MTMTEAVERLERVDDLFGDISTNLVYICEELPSLNISKETESRIVGFCCTFLERLVEEDKSIQRILSSVKGNIDRIPSTHCCAPEGAAPAIEQTTSELRKNVQSMDALISQYRGQAGGPPSSPLLGALLNESGANILKAFEGIDAELGTLLEGWKQDVTPR